MTSFKELKCDAIFLWVVSLSDLGRWNLCLLNWASSREAGFSGKPLPCLRTAAILHGWVQPGSRQAVLSLRTWMPTVTDHDCTRATSPPWVAVPFIQLHFPWLEDRRWLSGTRRELTHFSKLASGPQHWRAWSPISSLLFHFGFWASVVDRRAVNWPRTSRNVLTPHCSQIVYMWHEVMPYLCSVNKTRACGFLKTLFLNGGTDAFLYFGGDWDLWL